MINVLEMIDLCYANKHLYEKIKGYQKKIMTNKDELNVEIVDVWPIDSELYHTSGIGIDWMANIGWGQYILTFGEDGKLHADTEFLDSNDDKRFTKAVLTALADEIIIDR